MCNMAKSSSFFNESVQLRDSAQQKRKQARSPAKIEADFMLKGQDQPHPCSVTDLGTGGLSIQTKSTLYQGDVIDIQLKLQGRMLKLPVEVVRVSGKSIGLKYQNLSDQDMAKIQDFIHRAFFNPDKKKT